jgi:high-affinity nickel-transport protein
MSSPAEPLMLDSDDEGNKNAIYLRLKNRSQYYHAKIPVLKRLPFPSIAIIALLVVVNIVVWIIVGIVLVSWFWSQLLAWDGF